MNGKSEDILKNKVRELKKLFPEAVTEGKVDFEQLKVTLGSEMNTDNERYMLNWAGKAEAFRILQQPTTATLAPAPSESVNFNNTENIFIEGENLEVLKVLQKSYYGKIKMIYIDPPYNTGNDSFIYPDKFAESKEEYLKRIGEKDEEGYLLKEGLFRKNSKENGQFHSVWLSMMYPRLFLARNLLRDDGVIFISIDDNEVHNLRMVMNEIFGEENFAAVFPWRKRTAKSDVPFGVSQDFEWILMYAKGDFWAGSTHDRKYYKSEDFSEQWRLADLTKQCTKEDRPNSFFTLVNPKNKEKYPANPNRVWAITKETFQEYYDKGKIVFPGDYDFLNISIPAFRVFENEDKEKNVKRFGTDEVYRSVSTLLPQEIGRTEDGTKEITALFDSKVFLFPKPSSLIKYLIGIIPENDFIVLDFFSGSNTSAHAVLTKNIEDGGKRKFVCVQLPEKSTEDTEALKAGYNTIAEIGKERIRRVIKSIKIDLKTNKDLFSVDKSGLDLGFKVFKLKESNFKIWRSDVIDGKDDLVKQMDMFQEPVKPGVGMNNMMWELMVKNGYELTTKVEEREISKCPVQIIAEGELVICLSKLTDTAVKGILALKPKKVICLDSLFEKNDKLKTNTALQMKDAGVEFKTI